MPSSPRPAAATARAHARPRRSSVHQSPVPPSWMPIARDGTGTRRREKRARTTRWGGVLHPVRSTSVDLEVTEVGSGDALVVFVHGVLDRGRSFDRVADVLAPECRLRCYDR